MNHRPAPVTREGIAKTAAGMRQHLAERGMHVTQEQMERRAIQAQRAEDANRRSRGEE